MLPWFGPESSGVAAAVEGGRDAMSGGWAEARSCSARFKGAGNGRSRLAALARIPAAALGLKENFGGTSDCRTADNEHTAASLGHSEELSVKHPVGPPIPEFFQPSKDDGHICSAVRGKKARDVLDENPTGSDLSDDAMELVPEARPLTSEASSATGHGEVLAREPSANKVGCSPLASVGGDVIVDVGTEAATEDAPARGVFLDLSDDGVSCSFESKVESSDAGEQGKNPHRLSLVWRARFSICRSDALT